MHRKLKVGLLALFLAYAAWAPVAQGQAEDDLNVYMMQATVKIEGQRGEEQTALGTAFILMRPLPNQEGAPGTVTGRLVLITAAHVLEQMQGDQAVIHLRTRQAGVPGGWIRKLFLLSIRRNGQPLWSKNPSVDVAVMYIGLGLPLFDKAPTTDLLADDEVLERYDITPGVELKCLGYPLGDESNSAGFPILRTGDIASYPLLPTAQTKTFLFDFRVLKGNSGGPVYFSQPQFRGGVKFGGRAQFIMGLVSDERVLNEPYGQYQLSIGIVVHASLIRQTVNLLPAPETADAESVTVRLRPIQ
jgi:hypothetical protein